MKFYHYTAISMAESILSSSISIGHLRRADGSVLQGVVWLTTADKSYGHGLTNGKERLTDSQIAFTAQAQGAKAKNNVTIDKFQVRLTLELDPSVELGLERFSEYCKKHEPPHYAKYLGLTAVTKTVGLETEQLRKLMRTMNTKDDTWWLSWQAVPATRVVAVDFWTGNKYVPYNFEAHGRQAMEDLGFIIPSKESMASLSKLLPSGHAFEQAKALVLCVDSEPRPTVVVRGSMGESLIGIEDGSFTGARSYPLHAGVESWVKENKQELLQCWERAIASYHAFNRTVAKTSRADVATAPG